MAPMNWKDKTDRCFGMWKGWQERRQQAYWTQEARAKRLTYFMEQMTIATEAMDSFGRAIKKGENDG